MPPARITLFEHQFCAYDDLPAFPKELAAREQLLDRIDQVNQSAGREILHAGRKGLHAQAQVGVMRVGDLSIQILPKIDDPKEDPAATKPGGKPSPRAGQSAARNLLRMLAGAYAFPIHEQDISLLETQPIDWFELLTRLFAAGLHRQIRSGLSQGYTVREETLPVLRGRWDIQRQVRLHTHQRHIFDVTHDEFSADIALNQVFRYVVYQLYDLSQDASTRLQLNDLANWFSPVSELREIPSSLLESIQFNRLNERFEPSFNLSRLFLSGSAIRPAHGDLPACAFVFDMNDLFERFVASFIVRHRAAILPEALHDAAIFPQSEGWRIYLARSEGRPVARLRPDLLFKRRGDSAPILIADTKYMRLDPAQRKAGVAPDDLYQMLAYALRLDCPRVLMLYPEPLAGGPIRKTLEIEGNHTRLTICTVNLRAPLDQPDGLIREMKEIFTIALR